MDAPEPKRTDEQRASYLARLAVAGMDADPFRFRPLHARLAIAHVDAAIEHHGTIPVDLREVFTARKRAEAIAWLVEFEQRACGLV